ncbi:hypothetical protein DFH06DRAFT_1146815 [Mycena polygramma]|nr:hypothetical protein DFH06DRAFT_1146815 [Mycena polygramma]
MDSTSESLVSRFPQELRDKIVSENGFDMPTLRSCALVCHSFLPASQAQIFSKIHLKETADSTRPEANIQTLHDILVGAPHLRSYVRTLSVRLIQGDEGHHQYYACLVSVLQLFPAVTFFDLSGDPADQCEWRHLPRELRTAITEFCRRSDLATLWLYGLGTFTDLAEFIQLVSSPSLKNLQLDSIILTAPEIPWRNPMGLIELDLNLVHEPTQDIVMNWLIQGGSLVELRRVSLLCQMETVAGVQRILNMSPNIENLTLHPAPALSITLANSLSLANLKKLRELQVHIYVVDPEDSPRFCPLLAELLKPRGKSLEILKLKVYLLPGLPGIIDWTPLANMLTAEAFPVLGHIQVWAHWHSVDEDPVFQEPADRFLVDARRGLHHLEERGMLECKLRPW